MALFDSAAGDYDRARRQLIPRFDDFYRAVADLIPYDQDADFSVLDLGAGTGLLSAALAQRFAQAHFTLVDIAPEMLKQAMARFADGGERFSFQVRDYSTGDLDGLYDAVVSAVSIHHLPNENKARLFRSIFSVLRPGAPFINADQVLGETPEIEALQEELWLEHANTAGISPQDLADAQTRMKEDKSATVGAQLLWLEQAGFRNAACLYRNFRFAVFCAMH